MSEPAAAYANATDSVDRPLTKHAPDGAVPGGSLVGRTEIYPLLTCHEPWLVRDGEIAG